MHNLNLIYKKIKKKKKNKCRLHIVSDSIVPEYNESKKWNIFLTMCQIEVIGWIS